MRFRWILPIAVVLLVLTAAILLVQGVPPVQAVQATLEISKTVDSPVIAPPKVLTYQVVLTNTTAADVEVDVVDTLPTGFEYMGMASSELPLPSVSLQTLTWSDLPVKPTEPVTLSYFVWVRPEVPLSATPYTNHVVATVGAEQFEDGADVLVGIGSVTMTKDVRPDVVRPGELVTFTLAFANSGYVPMSLSSVSDALPDGVTFSQMTDSSDVSMAPSGSTGVITWTGPLSVPGQDGLVLEFEATAPVTSAVLALTNEASGELEGGTILTDSVSFEVREILTRTVVLPIVHRNYKPAIFEATKKADPTLVYNDTPGLVVYEVEFVNTGTVPGEIASIHDTLPPGFTFVKMMDGSQVTSLPSGTTGEIVWTGPFTVQAGASLKVLYQVQTTTTPGVYENSVVATVSKGWPMTAPVKATISVKEPYLLQEEFERPSGYWKPFLNYWRLKPEQWYYANGISDDGSRVLRHSNYLGVTKPENGAHDALFVYQNPEAEKWTDYSFKARVYLGDGPFDGEQIGLFFRGIAHEDPELTGRYVTGYYFVMLPGADTKMRVILMQLRTDEECGDDCAYNYHFSNPLDLLELRGINNLRPLGLTLRHNTWYWMRVDVQGSRIRCYVNDIQVFDYNDTVGTTFTEGTVGFFVYQASDARFDHVSVQPMR